MQGILDKKIPSLLGIFIIAIGIASTTFLVKGNQVFQTNAGPGSDPKNIQITNVSDSSFTVIYTTDSATIGTVKQGKSSDLLDQTFLDDRDKGSQNVNDYKTHIITVNNLIPNTTYYFSIDSGDNTVTNNGTPFNVTTGPKINNSSFQSPIKGKVVSPDGKTPAEGIVFASINGSQVKATYVEKDGSYTIPMNDLRTLDLNEYFIINDNSIVSLEVNSDSLSSKISASSSNFDSIPTITLSNNYDFSNSYEEVERNTNSDNVKFPVFKSRLRTPNTNPVVLSPTRPPKQ